MDPGEQYEIYHGPINIGPNVNIGGKLHGRTPREQNHNNGSYIIDSNQFDFDHVPGYVIRLGIYGQSQTRGEGIQLKAIFYAKLIYSPACVYLRCTYYENFAFFRMDFFNQLISS